MKPKCTIIPLQGWCSMCVCWSNVGDIPYLAPRVDTSCESWTDFVRSLEKIFEPRHYADLTWENHRFSWFPFLCFLLLRCVYCFDQMNDPKHCNFFIFYSRLCGKCYLVSCPRPWLFHSFAFIKWDCRGDKWDWRKGGVLKAMAWINANVGKLEVRKLEKWGAQ